MSNIESQKYSYLPEAIEKKSVKSEKFRDIYDFYKLFKMQKYAKRYACPDLKKDKSLRRQHFSKSTTEYISFFNPEQVFVGRNVAKTSKDN